MESDTNLAFNFSIDEKPKSRPNIHSPSTTHQEKSESKKRKQQLHMEKNVLDSQRDESTYKDPGVSPRKTSTIKKSSMEKNTNKVTSSLFTKNPEVPKLDKQDVTQIVEDVFSEKTFSTVDSLHPHMVKNLETRMGFSIMTSIQRITIPAIRECNRDILVQSQTGSGKTLAYAIPIVNCLQAETPKINRSDGTFAVVIVPTRELAIQSFECFQKLLYPFTWIVPGCLMGGVKRKAEKARIRKGINILVATPGRLLDHLNKTENLNMGRLRWIIIDEADKLLDLGYEKLLQEVLTMIKAGSQFDHHCVLLSATLSTGVERLAGMSLVNPLELSVSEKKLLNQDMKGETFAIPEGLSQKYTIVPMKLRLVTLSAFIMDKFANSHSKAMKIIVFLSTHVSVDFHYDIFKSVVFCKSGSDDARNLDLITQLDNVKAYKLHGEMSHPQRMETFQKFVETKSGVLFCTDVAARGLHLPRVKWIIQYTVPPSCSEYIHRIGRTARVGGSGNSLLFLLPSEVDYISLLNQQQLNLDELDMHHILKGIFPTDKMLKHSSKASHSGNISENATHMQNMFEQYILGDHEKLELAGKASLSYIRGYATYPKDMKLIFNIRNLHLGHVAKSFALRQAPKGLGQKYGGKAESKTRGFSRDRPKKRNAVNISRMSEFSDGDIFSQKKKKLSKHDEDESA